MHSSFGSTSSYSGRWNVASQRTETEFTPNSDRLLRLCLPLLTFVDVELTLNTSIAEFLYSNVDGKTLLHFFLCFSANSLAVASVTPKPLSKTLPIRLNLEAALNVEDTWCELVQFGSFVDGPELFRRKHFLLLEDKSELSGTYFEMRGKTICRGREGENL